MPRFLLCLAVLAFAASAARAQAPVDSVTVTAPKDAPNEVVQKFIQGVAAPSALSGKLTRWSRGICPVMDGLRPEAMRFILGRLKDNAARVGAPVDAQTGCKPNIEIVFTTAPQALMNNVRRKNPGYLGYHRRARQANDLARVKHPIQAWYLTNARDNNGRRILEAPLATGLDGMDSMATLPNAVAVSGSRVRDGLSSELYHVIIVADPLVLADREVGGLADYISMLALSQVAEQGRCQPLPSIIDMLLPGCASPVGEMSQSDLAFLRGLYRMPGDYGLSVQKAAVSEDVKRSFRGE